MRTKFRAEKEEKGRPGTMLSVWDPLQPECSRCQPSCLKAYQGRMYWDDIATLNMCVISVHSWIAMGWLLNGFHRRYVKEEERNLRTEEDATPILLTQIKDSELKAVPPLWSPRRRGISEANVPCFKSPNSAYKRIRKTVGKEPDKDFAHWL